MLQVVQAVTEQVSPTRPLPVPWAAPPVTEHLPDTSTPWCVVLQQGTHCSVYHPTWSQVVRSPVEQVQQWLEQQVAAREPATAYIVYTYHETTPPWLLSWEGIVELNLSWLGACLQEAPATLQERLYSYLGHGALELPAPTAYQVWCLLQLYATNGALAWVQLSWVRDSLLQRSLQQQWSSVSTAGYRAALQKHVDSLAVTRARLEQAVGMDLAPYSERSWQALLQERLGEQVPVGRPSDRLENGTCYTTAELLGCGDPAVDALLQLRQQPYLVSQLERYAAAPRPTICLQHYGGVLYQPALLELPAVLRQAYVAPAGYIFLHLTAVAGDGALLAAYAGVSAWAKWSQQQWVEHLSTSLQLELGVAGALVQYHYASYVERHSHTKVPYSAAVLKDATQRYYQQYPAIQAAHQALYEYMRRWGYLRTPSGRPYFPHTSVGHNCKKPLLTSTWVRATWCDLYKQCAVTALPLAPVLYVDHTSVWCCVPQDTAAAASAALQAAWQQTVPTALGACVIRRAAHF